MYLLDEHGLMAEYRHLPSSGGSAAARLVRLLTEAPSQEQHRSLVPGDTQVIETREAEPDGIALELNDAFWDLPPGERYAAAAQVVHTMAALEDGKNVVLMEGSVPGEIRDGSGRLLPQPLSRSSFPDLRPWIEIHQPVPGSLVTGTLPVRGKVQGGRSPSAALEVNGKTEVRAPFEHGRADLLIPVRLRGSAATVVVSARWDGTRRTLEVPVRISRN